VKGTYAGAFPRALPIAVADFQIVPNFSSNASWAVNLSADAASALPRLSANDRGRVDDLVTSMPMLR
jgi:hypothetical protein